MVAVGRGAVVNISSISGHVGVPGIPQASYAASKMGLSGLTAELAVQWAPQSIRVNTVAPGFFKSEITESGLYRGGAGKPGLVAAEHASSTEGGRSTIWSSGAVARERRRPLRHGADDGVVDGDSTRAVTNSPCAATSTPGPRISAPLRPR